MSSDLTDLTGKLLLAHPITRDPNFRHTIVYVAAHDPSEGSLGFVVNRPMGQKLSDVLPSPEFEPLAGVPVLQGGPVGTDQLVIARLRWDAVHRELIFQHHIPVEELDSTDPSGLHGVLAFVGYSGWGKGQLDAELDADAWVVEKPDGDYAAATESTWKKWMRRLGPQFQLMAEMPDDPMKN
ncbi:MAG TPA: YqgE/AlgH family protein [Chthoniobacterales bacterium]